MFGTHTSAPAAFGQPAPAAAFGAPAAPSGGLFGAPGKNPLDFLTCHCHFLFSPTHPPAQNAAPAATGIFGAPAPAAGGLFGAPAPGEIVLHLFYFAP